MRVITIQHVNVYKELMNKGEYRVSSSVPISENLVKPYEFMMKHYRYKTRPIFYGMVGHRANFGGAKLDNSVIMELEIPDIYCKVQDYYGWSDFIYFTEIPYEFSEFKGCKTVDDFGRYILDMYKAGRYPDNIVYQVTTQFIRKGWIKAVRKFDKDFTDEYYDNGGRNILKSIINKQ